MDAHPPARGAATQRTYRKFSAKQKLEIVLAGLRGDRSVRDVCREHGIAETLYHSWRDKLLEGGAKVTATIERLRAASELGAIESAHARTLEEAYDLFTALRLEHQIQQLERGNEPNDCVDPKELSELTRRYLRDAFREVAAVQKSLSRGRV